MDYKNKLEEAKRLYETANADQRYVLESLFPELKESDDERIRKALIHLINEQDGFLTEINGINVKDILNWLEEQGEHKLVDNVEPKFHEGDLIVDNCGYVWKIEGILNRFYILEGIEGGESRPTIEWVDKTFHLWSIQDAKDGDVLVTENKNIFIFKSINDCTVYDYCGLYHGEFMGFSAAVNGSTATQLPTDYVPAAKEQRDTLMKAMNKAGYTFDFKKKELKKVEPKSDFELSLKNIMEEAIECGDTHNLKADAELLYNIAQKSAEWSEEDEHRLKDTIYFLDTAKTHYASTVELDACINWLQSLKFQPHWKPAKWSEEDERIRQCLIRDQEEALDDVRNDKYGHSEIVSDLKEMYRERIDWLKSLRPQNTWKPSDEQIKAIRLARSFVTDDFGDNPTLSEILMELEKQLQKIKEKQP